MGWSEVCHIFFVRKFTLSTWVDQKYLEAQNRGSKAIVVQIDFELEALSLA